MKCLLVSIVCLQFSWSFGNPTSSGAGAYSYQDSTGRRYGGSYGLKDGEIVHFKGDDVPPFGYNFPPYANFGGFMPDYFRNFQNFFPFPPGLESQKLGFHNPDFASNNIGTGFMPNFPNFGMPNFGGAPPNFHMPNFGMPSNAAIAAAAKGPGYMSHFAAINPPNPNMPNVDVVSRFGESEDSNGPGFVGVSSSSYSTFSNINGKETGSRGAETVVNDNGKITKYSVHS